MQKQKIELEKKVTRAKLLNADLSELEENIINLITEHGRLTITEIQILTKANRNTLKKTIAGLVKNKNLSRHGKGRTTWYALH
jgi:predicted HTH transcriptional regulator